MTPQNSAAHHACAKRTLPQTNCVGGKSSWHRRDSAGGSNISGELWRIALAELTGTALLVLMSCLPGASGDAPPLVLRALCTGLIVTIIVQSIDHVSGAHVNPTVSLAAAVAGTISWRRAGVEVAAQMSGALLGAAAIPVLVPTSAGDADAVLVTALTLPAPEFAAYKAAILEGICGAALALLNCAAWDANELTAANGTATADRSWSLRVGAGVAGLTFAAGNLTGASINPARSFAPALLTRNFTHHWVYWAGPLGGAGAAALLYSAVWRRPRMRLAPPSSEADEQQPLKSPAV